MMEDNSKNLKQNEVIKMKNEGDFQILVEDHFKALDLDDNQRKAALDILADADAIVDENGERHISVRAYTDYVLLWLDKLSNSAKELESFDDLRNYEFLTRGFLHEWTVIIGNISQLIAIGYNLDEIDESEKTLDGFIGNMRDILEHLVDANKLYIKFGRASKDNPTGGKT